MKKELTVEGRDITLLGTAHVSKQSMEEVKSVIDTEDPDLVAVELDDPRLQSLRNKSGWREMDLSEAIKEGKGGMLFANLMLSIYQRRIGLEEGVEPGKEMLSAFEKAEEKGIDTALIDRDIGETLERLRSELSLWQKYMLIASVFVGDEEQVDVEDVKQPKTIEKLIEELGDRFPAFKRVLLDERNRYMARELLERDFEHAVVVVGAAHIEGLEKELQSPAEEDIQHRTSNWPVLKIIKYGFPLVALATLGLTFFFNQCKFQEVAVIWVGFNAILAGLGAIIARSHPLTILSSVVAAPFTSLDPAIGAGYVASYVEAKYYPPTVEELENLPYVTEFKQLWYNQAGRILLALVFVTLGSAAATFLGTAFGIEAATGAC